MEVCSIYVKQRIIIDEYKEVEFDTNQFSDGNHRDIEVQADKRVYNK